jgi:hypothetical protein
MEDAVASKGALPRSRRHITVEGGDGANELPPDDLTEATENLTDVVIARYLRDRHAVDRM